MRTDRSVFNPSVHVPAPTQRAPAVRPLVEARNPAVRQHTGESAFETTVVPRRAAQGLSSLPSDPSQANQFFLTQVGGSNFNSAAASPRGNFECGPTSALMILTELGLTPKPAPDGVTQAQKSFRHLALGNSGENTTYALGPDWMLKGLQNSGAQASIISRYPNPAKPSDVCAQMDQALAQGHPLMLGSGGTYDAWGADQAKAGNYLPPAPKGHWVAVLGKTADGQYLVGDPLVKGGAIVISAEKMQALLSHPGGVDLLEVSKPNAG